MISYHKLGTLTYHTLSKVMISVWLFYQILSLFFFFFFSWGLLGLALPSLGFGPSLSFVLTLEEVNCGITRETLTPKVFFYIIFYVKTSKYAFVIDIGEGQQWNRARRIYPKSRALGDP